MGHRNTQFTITGHMLDMETDQQGHNHPHPEPSIFYGSVANFPHPSFHSMIPTQANQCNFNFHHMPEHALYYGMPPQHQALAPPNLDLAIGAPSAHYNPYLPPPSGIRDFPVQVNHGTHDQLSLSTAHRVVGIPTDAYARSIPYMESIRASFKRKNADGASGSFPYHNASAGPSSSIAPVTTMTPVSDITMLDASPSFLPPNDPTIMVENALQRSARNRPRMIGQEQPILAAHNAGHLIQGNFPAQPVQLPPGNPWMDMQYGANHGDAAAASYAWTHAHPHYPHVPGMSTGLNGANRSSSGFLHPAPPQGHPVAHSVAPPMQGVRGFNAHHPSQVAAPSHQIPAITSSNTGIINHFQDNVEAGSSFLAPVPPMGFRSYRPPRREFMLDYARHPNFPQMRVLPEEEVAMLEFPGYREVGVSIDQHRDMRLDIDHMSYEELLALGEQIGSVGTGLSEEFIHKNLKIRTFSSSAACNNLDATNLKQQQNFCVVCQMDYNDGEEIGTVDCGHEYHRGCIKKWLLTKNTCPVCKSTALSHKAKES